MLLRRFFATLLATIICATAAHAWWVSRDARYNTAFPPTYQGPGDVQSGALAAWLTSSCYTAAYSGNVADIVDSATGNTTGTRLQCSNGVVSSLVSGSACTFVTGHACTTLTNGSTGTCDSACRIVTLYDQTQGTQCGGSPCDLTQATNTNRPTYVLNAVATGFGCANIDSSALQTLAASGTFTLAQTFTIAMVSNRTSGTADLFAVVRNTVNNFGTVRAGYTVASNKADIYAGTVQAGVSATDTHYHQLTDVFATSPTIAVDGGAATSPGGSVGSTGFSSTSIAWGWAGAGTTVVRACDAELYGNGTTVSATALYNNAVSRYGSLP